MDLNFICERILNNKKFEVKIYMRQSKFKLASARNSLALAANLVTREVVGIVVVVDKVFVLHHRDVKVARGLDAADDELLERNLHLVDSSVSIGVPDDELADHTVVVRRDRVVLIDVAVHTHVSAARTDVFCYLAGTWSEGVWILGRDAALDGVAF